MADAKIVDIKGVQWELKDEKARNSIVTLDDRISAIEKKKYQDLSWQIAKQDNTIFTRREGEVTKTIFEIPSFNLDKGGRFLLIINYIYFEILSDAYQFILRLKINGKEGKIFYNNYKVTNNNRINGVIAIELKEGINNLLVEGVTTGGKEVIVYSSLAEPFLCSLIQLS